MTLRNPVLNFESNPSPPTPHFSIRATQKLRDLISKWRQFGFGSRRMTKFAPYLVHPFRSRCPQLNGGASDNSSGFVVSSQQSKRLPLSWSRKARHVAVPLLDCGLLHPHPLLFSCCEGEKQLCLTEGLPPLLVGKQFYQGTILCSPSCLHHCNAPTACLLPSSRSARGTPQEAAACDPGLPLPSQPPAHPGEARPEHWRQTRVWLGGHHILPGYPIC